MTDKIILEDIMLDTDELGLAESLLKVDSSFTTTITSDEEVEPGDIVYFGVDLSIGDIGEVQGKIMTCREEGEDLYLIDIEIQALDSRYVDLLTRTLKGETESTTEGDGVKWATGLKQTNGSLAALVNCPAGLLNSAQLNTLAELSEQGHGLVKLTHAQRIIMLLKPEQLETFSSELEKADLRVGVLHSGIRNIRGCCGALCQFAQNTDGLGLAIEIDKALYGRQMKFDVKIAVSDCVRNCMECFCVDIGLIGDKGKYNIFVGGSAASVHLKGLKIAEGVAPEETIPLIEKILGWYDEHALEGERVYKTLERLGKPLAEEREDGSFAKAASLFADFNFGVDVARCLTRSLCRSFAVKQIQRDLDLA